MKPQQVCRRVYQIGGPGITGRRDCCVYLVDGGSQLAIIDAGLGESAPAIVENVRRLGFEPSRVKFLVLTHGHIDHIGGAAYLKESLELCVLAHEGDLPAVEKGDPRLTAAGFYGVNYRPVKVDKVIKGKTESLKVGELTLILLYTPGHTPGSVSPFVDVGGERVLFGQDVHGPFDPAWGSDLKAWRNSMAELLSLNADVLCEGHFGVYRPGEEVRKYIEGYLQRYSR
ncbi:MBL fold metallo-hydrolase [Desulfovirgula thermocuniculi]|uniref:MBL fold metallo-hydrolase n=1 Tax=Desulfovirgula thermocuniculi TaxID=348842 RepID=UPI000404021B|nr:MBL fold metallo-hydrolase [Desulfovirgula thermocuniculi]